ncbi:heat-inducible transcriptional repressor HrcA [Clostridium sp.]|jgi:heat-inducible transcriptional repressor|uniref:heat-inducible transcriptional repressor HrcA n=1 Tax=Clostridium sp. TaxID=1506 RepID=UPI003A5BC539
MEMDERKIRILQAIIHDYIKTAEPVGSRTIARKYDMGISSATIRNEMADLEDMGYLEQLHSSSGRKPSNKGYRLYVDKLMHVPDITQEEMYMIKQHILNSAIFEMDKIIKQATLLLSELTKLTCIVKTPSVSKSYIKHLQLINIESNHNILFLIVTDNGVIKNNVIRIGKNVSDRVLTKLSNILCSRLKGLNSEQINLEVISNIKAELSGYEDIFNAIIPVLYDNLNSADNVNIYMQGTVNIFNYPEYKDIEKAKGFLSMLDNKEKVSELLNNSSSISIRIGNENYIKGAEDCSVISAVYNLGNKPIGNIGLIGPTRIPYSKVVSLLTNVVKELNYILTNTYFDDN